MDIYVKNNILEYINYKKKKKKLNSIDARD